MEAYCNPDKTKAKYNVLRVAGSLTQQVVRIAKPNFFEEDALICKICSNKESLTSKVTSKSVCVFRPRIFADSKLSKRQALRFKNACLRIC